MQRTVANADEPSRLYAESTKKSCEEIGIEFEFKVVGKPEQKSQPGEVEQAVLEANMDDGVDGIMVCFFSVLALLSDARDRSTILSSGAARMICFGFSADACASGCTVQPKTLTYSKQSLQSKM